MMAGIKRPRHVGHGQWEERRGVTICIAASFQWNSAPVGQPPKWVPAIITASDRMMTAGDIQHQPKQPKLSNLTDKILVLIAGDVSVHSQAVRETKRQVAAHKSATVHNVATIYGQAVQSVRRKLAEDQFLAPLGLNTDTFMPENGTASTLTAALAQQIQNFEGPDVAALIVSAEPEHARIYVIDKNGSAHCFDDVGFAAIGSGSWHARSTLIQRGHYKMAFFSPTLTAVFEAKKAAEVAPGVGKITDINIVFPQGVEKLRSDVRKRLGTLYKTFVEKRKALIIEQIEELNRELANASKEPPPDESNTDPSDEDA